MKKNNLITNIFIIFLSLFFSSACHAAQNVEFETGEVLSELSSTREPARKVAELSYKMAAPSKIKKLTLDISEDLAREKRAKKIEILTSEFETDDNTYWLSSGTFTMSDTAESVVCEFEPVEAQYIKIRVLESYGAEVWPYPGKVSIGLNTFKLIGNITDFDAGLPVEGAQVYISGEKKAQSNKNGDFALPRCDYSTLEISIKAEGYVDLKENIPVFSGRKVSLAFKIKKHSYSVYGKATDAETTAPIALAEISLAAVPENGTRECVKKIITDEFGFYHIEDVKSGSYEIMASAEDYKDLKRPVAIDPSKSYCINFLMKKKPEAVKFSVLSVFPMSGEAFTDEIKVLFNKSVLPESLKPDNFSIETHYESIGDAIGSKESFEVATVGLAAADVSGKTVYIKIKPDKTFEKMPALDINILEVSSSSGENIAEEGVLISNIKR